MSNASGSAGDGGAYQKLPPGWDCKYDQATGNCYYINYLTKAMQLEDPRTRYKQLQNERCSTESIPLQHMVTQPTSSSSASPYHVYPSNSLTAVRAFQERHCQPQPSLHNMSASPLLSSRGHLDMSSPVPFSRSQLSHTPRLGQQHMSRRSTIQETSFTNQIDTDAVVARIQNMFPTAGENHIRLLLKRYYNREAVVISALQVEKYPVTMPGPYVTPPAQRHLYHSNSAFYMTPPARRLDMAASRAGGLSGGFNSRTASPIPGGRFGSAMSMQSGATNTGAGVGAVGAVGVPAFVALHGSPRFNVEQQWRSSPKPHSSPKMKLRYMKNIFPKADETLLLDVLANADNNVQTASEKLIQLGYIKRDFVPAKPNNRPPTSDAAHVKQPDDERHIPLRPKAYTDVEKTAMQALLKQKYPQIAERIILMALESVNYAEDRATQILQIVQEEDMQRDQKQHKTALNLQTAASQLPHAANGEESDGIDGSGIAQTDSILTVVLETTTTTTTTTASTPQPQPQAQPPPSVTGVTASHNKHTTFTKKHKLPAINVTTPTTATTQIILSNSPIEDDNDAAPETKFNETSNDDTNKKQQQQQQHNDSPISLTSPSTHSYASPTHSSTRYEPLTTKGILARSSGNAIAGYGFGCGSGNGGGGIISGYLHGSSLSSSSYSSYTTSMKLLLSSSSSSSSSSASSSTTSSTSSSAVSLAGKLTTTVSRRARTKSDSLKNSQRSSTEGHNAQNEHSEFQSIVERMSTLGHNSELAKGADEKLLLADYVTWNGANPMNMSGQKQMANGPDAALLCERGYKPTGRNPELCKGAQTGLAKGSIYARTKTANIKCN